MALASNMKSKRYPVELTLKNFLAKLFRSRGSSDLPTFESLCNQIDLSQQPALDRADAVNRAITDDQKQWVDEGVVIKRGFFPASILDPYIKVREALGEYGQAALLGGWQSGTPYMYIPELRQLSLYPPLMDLLGSLLGEPAMLTLNLTGWITSDRNWHQDSYLNPPHVGGWYLAVWIALDDIHADSGPFEYIPGSHRWPLLSGDKVKQTLPADVQGQKSESGAEVWPTLTQDMLAKVIDNEITARGGKVEQFLGAKGDLLVWHGRLMHRGSPALEKHKERRSLIAHYNVSRLRPDMPASKDANGYDYFASSAPLVWPRSQDGGLVMEVRQIDTAR